MKMDSEGRLSEHMGEGGKENPVSDHAASSPKPNKFRRKKRDVTRTKEGEEPGEAAPTVALYDKTKAVEVLTGISLAALEPEQQEQEEREEEPRPALPVEALELSAVSDTLFCTTCNITFDNRNDQKDHYRCDWHRFNLKQKLKGAEIITEEQFEEITGDISSISGSDSSESEDSTDTEELGSSSKLKGTAALWKHMQEEEAQGRKDVQEEEEMSYHIEGEGRRHPKVFFRNAKGELISIYRCVLHGKKKQPESKEELVSMARALPEQMTWALFMTGGGHFAAAMFEGDQVLEHKTFHRYVVRAKRGTAQSTRDQKGGSAPKSAGASLRRYNEAALTQDIQDLIKSWAEPLSRCSRIFLRAPSFNKAIFFGGKTPALSKQDPRIRMIPFQTRRPTFKELKRVHGVLAAVDCYGTEASFEDHVQVSPKKASVAVTVQAANSAAQEQTVNHGDTRPQEPGSQSSDSDQEGEDLTLMVSEMTLDTAAALKPFEATKRPRKKRRKEKGKGGQSKDGESQEDRHEGLSSDLDPETQQHRNELYTACKVGDTERFTAAMEALTKHLELTSTSHRSEEEHQLNTEAVVNMAFGERGLTLLHVAAHSGSGDMVTGLLAVGADPSLRDKQGQYPYVVAANKETRNQFRKFRASFPDKYDYAKSQIPEPLTEEMENEKKAREAEKRKAQRKAKKERMKGQKELEMQARNEEREKQRFLSLSEREKRALAAERRLLAQKQTEGEASPVLSRCWQCGADITGKVPFEYYDYKFCTPKCLKEHKTAAKR